MNKKNIKKYIFGFCLIACLFFTKFALAQADFGMGEVDSGLDGVLVSTDPRAIAGRIINILLGLLGIIAVLLIIYAGFKWLMSGGDEEKITGAKKILKNATIGLVIILSSWAIAIFILNKLGGATSGDGSGSVCVDGTSLSCGCGGAMFCSGGHWGNCIGSTDNCFVIPKDCNANTISGVCQANNQICASGYFCDQDCKCQPQGSAGSSCDADLTNARCDADNNRCSEYTTCDPESCLCVGSPVILGISPVGGFCDNNINKACLSDDDCGAGTCDTETPNGAVNNFLTIIGKNFGEYDAELSQVIFLGTDSPRVGVSPSAINTACVDFWSDEQIIIAIPSGAQSGQIEVITKDNLSDKTGDENGPKINNLIVNNISRPGLCTLDPVVGALNSQVNYQGVNLYAGKAYFGNYKSNVGALYSSFNDQSGLTGTSTIPNIRKGDSGSFVETVVEGKVQKSNFLKFTKLADENSGPYIKSFTPLEVDENGQKVSRGPVGQYITITGAGFGGSRGNSHVYFVSGSNKIEASYSFPSICANSVWNDHQIIVKAPEMAEDFYQIEIDLGETIISTQNLNPNVFQLNNNLALAPSLCKIDPGQGTAGTAVAFWGEYFGRKTSNIAVKFYLDKTVTGSGDETGNVLKEGGADKIKAEVPSDATTGGVKIVNTHNQRSSNELNFTVAECLNDDGCSAGAGKICCPSNTYKKGQCVASLSECFVNIPTSVFEWSFSTEIDGNNTGTEDDPSPDNLPSIFDSCLGLSKYLGSCYQGVSCPNSPGSCSSALTSYQKIIGTCDNSCQNVPGCDESTCTYNSELDRCVQNKKDSQGVCDFPTKIYIPKLVNQSANKIPRIMYWSGKVNQHWNLETGAWETDPDGFSGSGIDKLAYCNKFYKNTVAVEPYKEETINTWRERGNIGAFTGTMLSYRCVSAAEMETVEKTCNSSGQWEIAWAASCPAGWTKTGNRTCVQDGEAGKCRRTCDAGLNCQEINKEGRCVSDKVCSAKDAKCVDNLVAGEADNCVINVVPTCECCCRLGYEKQDCCAGLTCTGKCGSDITNNNNTYGYCSGCAQAGETTAARDAACNCFGSSSKYCSITTEHPEGICVDCAGLTDQASCGDHSSACCFDSNNTSTPDDDYCRGIKDSTVISDDKNSANYGYCSYYGCSLNDPYVCASTTPVKIGYFKKIDSCLSGCQAGVGSDYCRFFDNDQEKCSNEANCCYDKTTSKCKSGNKIETGENKGYCAYYACQSAADNPLACETTPTTTPKFSSIEECNDKCGNPSVGAGLDCSDSQTKDRCDFNACGTNGFACLQETGAGGEGSDCGACCCNPEAEIDPCVSETTPNLHCLANVGNCSGANRGLCCGCSQDSDCGSIATIGCNSSTCCEARPSIIETSPIASETNVCRNATIRIVFNQPMNVSSFSDNFLLYEELEYGKKLCPAGTFLAENITTEDLINSQTKNIFVHIWKKINSKISRVFNNSNKRALAEAPSADKLYCRVPGSVSAVQNGSQTELIFSPKNLLSPAANFYVVVKGDENLDSRTGVLSYSGVGMKGSGFKDGEMNNKPVTFNKTSYQNSYSFKFVTLPSQGVNAGICAIDNVKIRPASYLFKTTSNDLNENDSDILNPTFDTVADRDKLFSAGAYSVDGKLLNPVEGYSWDWTWSINNDQAFATSAPLSQNSLLVSAKAGATDVEAKLKATIDMSKYLSNDCSASGSGCNKIKTGNGYYNTSDLYIFLCQNPWPAVNSDGTWSPWLDKGQGDDYSSYNYKFYYCRDAGTAETFDDLPAISNNPISKKGSFSNLLKETYFFRETILPSGNIVEVRDMKNGGEVEVKWESSVDQVDSYKIYYLRSGRGLMMSKKIKPEGICSKEGSVYKCTYKIDGLTNNQQYIFKLTIVATNKTESALSNEVMATPTDKKAPATPTGLDVIIKNSMFNFSWQANNDDTAFYRLYHGISSGKYAETFDSIGTENNLSFPLNKFPQGANYFAISAIDSFGNESDKVEKEYYFNAEENGERRSDVLVWRRATSKLETPLGTDCLVEMDIESKNPYLPVCDENEKLTSPGAFVGKIALAAGHPYCSVSGCNFNRGFVNPAKCEYYTGSWTNNCYILN
ncbi:hypothetical protein GX917_00135 [Candidatus Falkowbacteria bacterium]|nr:hypothetical protein [Candidatus Falkowbacteria bacterium]